MVNYCIDCSQRLGEVCLTHLTYAHYDSVACVFYKKQKDVSVLEKFAVNSRAMQHRRRTDSGSAA